MGVIALLIFDFVSHISCIPCSFYQCVQRQSAGHVILYVTTLVAKGVL